MNNIIHSIHHFRQAEKDTDLWTIPAEIYKYWSMGALITMIGTFYTGYKGSKSGHKYFACSTLICMIMSMYTGHKMISVNKRVRKQVENTEAEE